MAKPKQPKKQDEEKNQASEPQSSDANQSQSHSSPQPQNSNAEASSTDQPGSGSETPATQSPTPAAGESPKAPEAPKQEPKAPESPVGKFVTVRTNSVGVWAGRLKSQKGDEIVLEKARRIWEWGNQSVAQIAEKGPDKDCKVLAMVASVPLKHKFLADPARHELNIGTDEAAKALAAAPIFRHA